MIMDKISFTHVGYVATFLYLLRALGICTAVGMDHAVGTMSKRMLNSGQWIEST